MSDMVDVPDTVDAPEMVGAPDIEDSLADMLAERKQLKLRYPGL